MSKKIKQVVIVAQCLVNPYCRVHTLGQNFPFSNELMNYFLTRRIGVIQYPCPETTAIGLMRNPMGRQQYDNIFFREHCKELLKVPLLMVREFLQNGYKLIGYIGVANSPTCSIEWGAHKVNRYGTESPNEVDHPEVTPQSQDSKLRGIMAELLEQELLKEGIDCPFIECPTNSAPDSEMRENFWEGLEKAIEATRTQHKDQ